MAKQTLVWTALPNGFDAAGDLRISALVSPRLEPDADQILKPFKDFLPWPDTVRNARFTIQYAGQSVAVVGNQVAGPVRVDDSIDVADSGTWTALLDATTPVSGFKFQDLAGTPVLSYDTVAVDSLARTLYTSLARSSGESLPKVSHILDDPAWQHLIDAVAGLDRMFVEEKSGLRDVGGQFKAFISGELNLADPVAAVLAHAQLFHTPPSKPAAQDYSTASLAADDPRLLSKTKWRTYERAKLPAPADFATLVDFHQIVAAMNSYPRLLRRLGLVVDFIVPRGAFAQNADGPLSVVCDIASAPGGVVRKQSSNTTHTVLSSTRFGAVAKAAPPPDDLRILDGLLNLTPNQFAIVQADVDGTGLKLMNFARTLHRLVLAPEHQVDAVTKFEKEAGAPALRNAGLMLVHRRRSNMLQSAFLSSQKKDLALTKALQTPPTGNPPDLYAEDVIRGWRVDMWDDKSAKWRSICQRKSTHSIGAMTIDDDREGMLRLATTKAADDSNPVLYLHEALLSWTGWSLVAPQPGRAIDKNDKDASADVEVPPGLPMKSVFSVPQGSLPRLRYGRSYKVRARMADLAANSLPPNEKDFGPAQPATAAVKYCRFEPLQAPSLALVRDAGIVEAPAEGETMDRLAIRTFNESDNTVPAIQPAQRYAVPARTTVREAELHGMFDSGGLVDGSASMFNLLATTDSALAQIDLVTPGPLSGSASVKTTYAVLDAPAADIPYLPDPLCIEIAARIFDHPTFPDSAIISIPVYPSGSQWPKAAPFTIRVIEDPVKPPHFDAAARVLEIPVPKAIRATLRLSCRLGDPSFMGVWNWLAAADRVPVADKAKRGQHWALTPWRTVELVHAVQKPLIAPEMKFRLSRGFGETRAIPAFTATCSLKSTARVDLQAAWHEPDVNSPLDPIGANRARLDLAFSVKITDPKTYATRQFDPKAKGIAEHTIVGSDLIGVNENHDLAITKWHEFNDTRYRRIEYWLEATTRFREYMPATVLTKPSGGSTVETDEHIKVTGPSLVAWVPNSSPPPVPQILYVVPTFGWSSSVDAGGKQTRWRRGGGLRVYLDRPWNVSGYGEMLAVVMPRAAFAGDPNEQPAKPYKKFVTQWGNDPIWSSPFVSGPTPKPANFPLARTHGDPAGAWLPAFAPPTEADQPPGPFLVAGLPHPALEPYDPNGVVDIAPHDVAYDPQRQLWYCDIVVNFGAAYYPFVRLALARYQPVSVSEAHLSDIVLADFMSLAPDRWLTVTRQDPAVRSVTVFGYGYSDSSGSREAKHSQSTPSPFGPPEIPADVSAESVVEVHVEKLDPALGEDFGWSREPAAIITRAGRVPLPIGPGLATARHLERAAVPGQAIDIGPILIWPILWQGTVKLPQPLPHGVRYRLVVAEYEEYLVDDATPYNKTPSAKGRRLVFTDHVELT